MIIDIVVVSILLISAFIAFLRGFIREVLTIFGTVGALVAAYMMGPVLSPVVRTWMGAQTGTEDAPRLFDIIPYTLIADALAYGGIFIVVVIALSMLSHILAESANKIGLGAIDRTLGVLFGLIRGILLLGLLYLPVHLLVDEGDKERWFKGSRTHFYLEQTAKWMSGFLPEDGDEKDLPEEIDVQPDAVKKKLKDMELLQDQNKNSKQDLNGVLKNGIDVERLLKKEEPGGKGYNENFRKEMDRLFQEETAPEKQE